MFLVDQNGNPCIYTSPKAQARLERERRDHRLMVRAGIAVVVFTLCCCVAAAIKAASESANASPSEYGPAVHVVRALGADLCPPDECLHTRGGLDLCLWDDDSGTHVVRVDRSSRI